MMRSLVAGLVCGLAISFAAGLAGAESQKRAKTGERCAGFHGTPCEEGLYCDLDAGHCGEMDTAGTCVAVPEICPEVYIPVCDCDGKTHSSDCHRQRAKAQKNHDGECKKGDAPAEG